VEEPTRKLWNSSIIGNKPLMPGTKQIMVRKIVRRENNKPRIMVGGNYCGIGGSEWDEEKCELGLKFHEGERFGFVMMWN
jgi:hypothetical protein